MNYRSTVSMKRRLGWQRIVAVFGYDFQIGAVHVNIKHSVRGGSARRGVVAQRVLVASQICDFGIGLLDRLPVELGKQLAAGGRRILWQNVPGAEPRHAYPSQLAVNGNDH